MPTVQPLVPAPDMGNAARGILLMLASMAVFSCSDGTAKALTGHMSSLEVTWGRYAFHTLFLLPVFLGAAGWPAVAATRNRHLQLARGALLFGSALVFITALGLLPLAEANVIGFVAPLIVTALSVPMLGERVDRARWLAVLAGFGGVVLVIRPGGAGFSAAALLPLLSASLWALSLILTRRLAALDSPLTTLFYTTITGMVLASLLVPLVWQMPESRLWLPLAALGAGSALGQYLLIQAVTSASASVLAPFQYSQLVWATAIGWLGFGTLPDQWSVAGAAVIIASGLYIWRRERRPGPESRRQN